MRNKYRLLTPGPTPLPEEVRLEMAKDMIHHRKPQFKAVMREAQSSLRTLFSTAQPVLTLSCSGTGGMCAVVTNCFNPGEKVIVAEAGKFGERWGEISECHGLNVTYLHKEWGDHVTADDIARALDKDPEIAGVLVQASETSTGVLHPIEEIGKVTKDRGTLLVVDGISAVGISPCPMDAWNIDCLLTGSQKGLMVPPGLALVALSPKGREKAAKATNASYYFNLIGELDKAQDNQTLFTSSVSLIVGLKESLSYLLGPEPEKGLEELFRKQWALTMLARTAVTAMGLELLAKDNFTWGLTSVSLPMGIDGQKLLSHAADEHGVMLAGGQGKLKGHIVRIGHMGHVDWGDLCAGIYAFAKAYVACGGHIGCRDYLEQGMAAYEEALNLPHGTR